MDNAASVLWSQVELEEAEELEAWVLETRMRFLVRASHVVGGFLAQPSNFGRKLFFMLT